MLGVKIMKNYLIISILTLILFIYIKTRDRASLNHSYNEIKTIINSQRKYIVYECTQYVTCGGWADRLKGIMSAYAIALLSDRHLVIKIKKTCDISKYLLPNEIDWNINLKNLNLSRHNLLINYNEIFIQYELKHINFTNYEMMKDVIVFRTGFNLMPYLAANPAHHTKLKQLGFNNSKDFRLENVFHEWYSKLFKFNKNLQLKYNKLSQNLRSNRRSKLICAQVRLGGGGEVSMDLKFTSRQNTALYWMQIKQKFLIQENTDFKLFVTIDTPDVIGEAAQHFGKDKVFGIKDSSYHIEHKRSSKQCDKLSELFIDFKILGDCDYGVISHSGYFYLIFLKKFLNYLKHLKIQRFWSCWYFK